MITVQDILTRLEEIAPYSLAESWDNVGLLCGDAAQEVTDVLCALDITSPVLAEAVEQGAQLVVAHHPAIFTPISRVTPQDETGRILRFAIQHNIAFICMHTNMDSAVGGVNDALAEALHLSNIINMEGGENKTIGRVGDLSQTMSPRLFASYVKQCLSANGVRYCDGGRKIHRIAVGGGACGSMMDAAIQKGADAFVIGDCNYSTMQKAQAAGLTLVDAGHFSTENPVVSVFAREIAEAFPDLVVSISKLHADCISFA